MIAQIQLHSPLKTLKSSFFLPLLSISQATSTFVPARGLLCLVAVRNPYSYRSSLYFFSIFLNLIMNSHLCQPFAKIFY